MGGDSVGKAVLSSLRCSFGADTVVLHADNAMHGQSDFSFLERKPLYGYYATLWTSHGLPYKEEVPQRSHFQNHLGRVRIIDQRQLEFPPLIASFDNLTLVSYYLN
jgi:hypothetical protein